MILIYVLQYLPFVWHSWEHDGKALLVDDPCLVQPCLPRCPLALWKISAELRLLHQRHLTSPLQIVVSSGRTQV